MGDPRVLACRNVAYRGSGSETDGAAFSDPAGGVDIIDQQPDEIATRTVLPGGEPEWVTHPTDSERASGNKAAFAPGLLLGYRNAVAVHMVTSYLGIAWFVELRWLTEPGR